MATKLQQFMESGAVARALGVSPQWINQMARDGKLTPDAETVGCRRTTRLYTAETVAKAKKELARSTK